MSSLREKREEEDALLRRAANAATGATNATNTHGFKSGNEYFEDEEEDVDVAAMMGFRGGFGSKKKKHKHGHDCSHGHGHGNHHGENCRQDKSTFDLPPKPLKLILSRVLSEFKFCHRSC